ncbi:MAG: peptidoglycan editing factor PgeF [Bacteroidales bacterium]|nr:peptidoglycan editing factor PgeF [Bacteroidales bacterium]
MKNLLEYDFFGRGVEAFSTRKGANLPYPIITGHQVHDCRIAVVDRPDMTRDELQGYDGLVTNIPGVAIGVRTADCIPVLLYDPVRHAVAAVHAGWKGTVKRIVQKAVYQMEHNFGTKAEDIRAVIGPGIGPDSFQVGVEVVELFKSQSFPLDDIWSFRGTSQEGMTGGHHIDLFKANRWLLEQTGVPGESIHTAGIDTYTDPTLFSARREGVETGRIISSIKLLGFPHRPGR